MGPGSVWCAIRGYAEMNIKVLTMGAMPTITIIFTYQSSPQNFQKSQTSPGVAYRAVLVIR